MRPVRLRHFWFLASVCLLVVALVVLSTSSNFAQVQPTGGGSYPDLSKIQHIIFLIKENRTFDNYFGQFPGANGTTIGVTSSGQIITLRHAPDQLAGNGTSTDSLTKVLFTL